MLDMLVENLGQIRLLARLKGKQAVKHSAQLQPFQTLLIRFSGQGDLKYLTQFELASNIADIQLAGKALYCGFYLNELCNRIIPINEPIDLAYQLYQQHLQALTTSCDVEQTLRSFEYQLLELLGYGVDFNYDAQGDPIEAAALYLYVDEQGWCKQNTTHSGFRGEQLMAFSQLDFSQPQTRLLAKQFARYLLKPLLGERELKSRELFLPR
ncbi:DNA repair protein recO (Recombination protein O) [Pseudoalteromonas tunicata D2]|jgi:DNA repair protein RecO (recombination protein O)|uniref:DNA repair protein RecO n=2 Tax=Pseudoalteromonas tunicata TaxID=314281 RepID=A4C6M8_9GAMM|nr:DNA repair protein recO (Recombination protein O) [Pseudoalteromonas tunicata D2]